MKYVKKHPMIMIVVSVVGIAMSSIFVRYSQAPSAVTAAYRLLWTVLLLTPVALGKRQNRDEIFRMGAKKLLLSALSGVFLAAHFALWFESLQHTTVASSTTIVCTEVIWVALGYCLFLRGKLSLKAVLAIGITLVGSVLIAWSDSGSVGGHLYGDILAWVAAIAVAVYTLIGQHIRKTVSTVPYTYVVYVSCAATLVLVCALRNESLAVAEPSAPVVGLLLAVFCTIMGHSVFTWCLKYFSPSFVSASKLCEPVVAAVMAGFLFGEMPKALQIIGGVLILGGVYYYSVIEGKKQ